MADDDLVFMMGKYEARFPVDRQYSRSHLWLSRTDAGFRVGFTAYAVRLLQDVYFLDWSIDPNTVVKHKQEIGQIESSKAVSTLYAPCEGHVRDFNAALMSDPSLVNVDNYDAGWLYHFETEAPLMSPQEYFAHLEATWEVTQRLLKSQYNE
ncbi:MAG: glycine cleavage system protein H [Planctomycetaceae bacterium]|nr:glycine cleavage system protein H [Planctomycetaceae bacterium]